MGAYLDKPVTAKRSSHGRATVAGSREVVYASTAMQGWRISMEDAHVIVPNFDESSALLAVFDGHGGKEVAKYCSKVMPEMLQSNEAYKSGDLATGLQQLFLDTDKRLLEKEVIMELKKLVVGASQGEPDPGSSGEVEEEGEEETVKLMEEANMPLENLLSKYVAASDGDKHQQIQSENVREGGGRGGRGGGGGGGGGGGEEGQGGGDRVKSMLQALASGAGFEIEFEDSDSEWTEEEEEEEEEEEKEEGEKEEEEEEEEEEGVKEEMMEEEDEVKKEEISDAEKLENPYSITEENSEENSNPPPPSSSTNSSSADPLTSPSRSKINGIIAEEGDKSPCAKDNSSPAENKSARVEDNSPCAKEKSSENNNINLFKNHTLLDLLTSAVTETTNHQEIQEEGGRENRKRRREEGAPPPMKKEKKFCRGLLDEEGYHSGTTAVLCLLRQDSLTVANAGDSRCVLSSAGKAVDMSEDHKPTDKIELSRIQKAGGSVGADGRVNGGLNLSRAIGDHFYKENRTLPLEEQMITALPDVSSRHLVNDDEFIVVACDGIWNTKSSQEVVDFIHSRLKEGVKERESHSLGPLLQTICEELCDDCLAADTDNDGTGCDNMTVAIVLLSPHKHSLPLSSPPPPPTYSSSLSQLPSLPANTSS